MGRVFGIILRWRSGGDVAGVKLAHVLAGIW
jgi:hypothetical protein